MVAKEADRGGAATARPSLSTRPSVRPPAGHRKMLLSFSVTFWMSVAHIPRTSRGCLGLMMQDFAISIGSGLMGF